MNWYQTILTLAPRPRGFHLITHEVEQALCQGPVFCVGLAHLFIQHTSASLTLSENADPDVRADLENHFNQLAPENAPYYRHLCEGPDDMPAHIKNCLLGSSLMLPVTQGRLALGTWQGIYLCEHRNRASGRRLVLTVQGQC